MELYQKVVLGIAIVLLIASYIMIFFTLVDSNKKWPPSVAKCPDFWTYVSNGDYCDSNSDGLNNLDSSNISRYPLTGKLSKRTKCQKYNWSKTNGISWDGLSYGVKNSC